MPLTVHGLESAFSWHLTDLDCCMSRGNFIAALHLLLALPNICAALETPNFDARGPEYQGWCAKYLTGTGLDQQEWWEMRNRILHQGWAGTDSNKCRYKTYSFTVSTARDAAPHLAPYTHSDGLNISIHLDRLVSDVKAAMNRWFQELERSQNPDVSANLLKLMSERPKHEPGMRGPSVVQSST